MHPITIILCLVPFAFLALAVAARYSDRYLSLIRTALAISGIPLLAFCVFGFMATFEPSESALIARTIYVLAIGLVAGALAVGFWPHKTVGDKGAPNETLG